MIDAKGMFRSMVKRRWTAFAGATLWATALLLAQNAEAGSIDAITTTQQGGNLIIKISLSAPLPNPPAGFTVATPARIALDFPGTTNNLGKTTLDANQGDLTSINIVQAGDRTRMVLNLKRLASYTTSLDGKNVLVTLTSSGQGIVASPTPATTTFSTTASASNNEHALRDVDFRRGADGEGRVIVDLSDSQTGIDIKTQGQTIVVDFLHTTLPENLRRRMVVTDFATPVQSINTFTQGDTTRMVIEPHGLWEHNAYQTDNRLVIEVKPVKEDPNKLVQGSGPTYKGERLSLNFQNVDVRSLLQVIADFTNQNIITSDSVGGTLTLRLKDVPWDQAFDIILQAKGLDKRKNGNVILVAPKDELATKEKLELEAKSAISDLEPLRSQVFQLNYQKADNVKAFLNGEAVPGPTGSAPVSTSSSGGASARVLSKRGSVASDPRTNQLFVQDIESRLETVRNIIARLDVPSRQVMIEARVVVADDGFTRELGNRLGYYNNNPQGDPLGVGNLNTFIGGSYGSLPWYGTGVANPAATLPSGLQYNANGQITGTLTALQGNTPLITNTPFVSLPAGGAANPASLAISLFKSGSTRFLNLELSALEQDNHGKVISSPRVVTADQVKAVIEQGTELPYNVATSSGATAIQFAKANLKLEVTPQITPEGNIILTVDVTDDSVGQLVPNTGYAINTKHVNTQVLVENGGTVVLGGIYELTDRNDTNKVPFFGDIPYLGYLFKSTNRIYSKTELLVFITPKMLSDKIAAQ